MIQIRDVPDDVHRTLRVRAAAAGLSLSEYLRRELQSLAERRTVGEVLEEWRGDRAHVSPTEVVDAILRDRR